MRSALYSLIFLVSVASAQKITSGRVTYLAAGSVYLSIGREQGLEDSMQVNILRGSDSIAVLKVFAVSSKSSVCRVVELKTGIKVGDSVVITIPIPPVFALTIQSISDSTSTVKKDTTVVRPASAMIQTQPSWVQIRGRIGLQYNAMLFDDASLNMQQPGLVVSVRGDFTNSPLKFDIYGTARRTGRNGAAPFSSKATNDSRIYRFSLEYDDQSVIIGAGRILPLYASSVGYIDGVSAAKRFGKIIGGASFGFQPDASLQMPSSQTKKFVLFGYYQPNDSWNTTASAAYARIWSPAGIEREVISSYTSMYTNSGLSIYASGEMDLRTISNGENKMSPALSLLICSANYRFADWITAGMAFDASRPVYSLSSNKSIPDSLLDKHLRSGASINFNLSLWRGTGIYNVYTLRFGETNAGKNYSNSSSVYYNNIIGTGVVARVNYLINENTMSLTRGFGINIQRNIFGVDCGVRYQRNQTDISQLKITNTTTTLGADISAFLTRQLTLFGSFDLMRGYGMISKSFFVELSRRF